MFMAYVSRYKSDILKMADETGYMTTSLLKKRFGKTIFQAWSLLRFYEKKGWIKRFPGRVGSLAGHFCWVFKITQAGKNEIQRMQRKAETTEPGMWG